MRMRAAVLYEVNKPLVVEEIELDPPKEGEVLVKMIATGVCHSDVHYFTGDSERMSDRPTILGHEGAGIVEEAGERVTKVKPGDHVIMTFLPTNGLLTSYNTAAGIRHRVGRQPVFRCLHLDGRAAQGAPGRRTSGEEGGVASPFSRH